MDKKFFSIYTYVFFFVAGIVIKGENVKLIEVNKNHIFHKRFSLFLGLQ